MNCPKCKGPMACLSHDGMQIDRCTKCGALWFDMLDREQLQLLPGTAPAAATDEEELRAHNEVSDVKCPICGDPMVKMVDEDEPHVWYELCPGCDGVFFDAGEYEGFRNETIGATCDRLFATQ